jgi:hypothetical protein
MNTSVIGTPVRGVVVREMIRFSALRGRMEREYLLMRAVPKGM